MAIHQSNKIESTTGFIKEFDKESLHMVMDNVQKYQYQYPQKSTIRELAANAVDSIKERDIAKLILTGKAKVEDYYVVQEGSEFHSSGFNKNYYDLKWLSTKENAEITYIENSLGKDKLVVRDEGVGLGGKRLEGYFKLNWSSKRLNKSAIGKFGIGAKAPLSTGIDSFRVTTSHNGKKFCFDVYSHKVDSVTEKFNAQGQLNPTYTFENGYQCYYEETTELNFTEIEVPTKKHHRSLYTDAVRSQLLYMPGVLYKVKDESGYERQIATKATVIYEDDDIILSDNNQYSKPHIVINNVCYSYIDFLELELENKNGNIGIKMNAENIDISPSRENVLWLERTREEVTAKFEKVQEIASNEVKKQLKEEDFGQWLVKCANVLTVGNSTNDILGRLSRVIDRTSLKPEFKNTGIKYKSPSELLNGVQIRVVTNQHNYNYRNSKTTSSIERQDIVSWNSLDRGIYYTKGSANNTKDKYLTSLKTSFVLLTLPEVLDEEQFKETVKNKQQSINAQSSIISQPIDTNLAWLDYKAKFEKQQAILDLLLASTLSENYDEVVVPESFLKKLEESEKEVGEGEQAKTVELTPAEKRKLEEKIVCYYPKWDSYARSTSSGANTQFSWIKHEPKLAEVKDWENVIYCFGDEDEKLLTVAWILGQQQCEKVDKTPTHDAYFSDYGLKLVRIAKGLANKFKQFTHVDEFFKTTLDIKANGNDYREIRMHNLFTKWYTGKLINEQLEGYKFLVNFSAFNQDIADKYKELKQYESENYKDLSSYYKQNLLGVNQQAFDAITTFSNKVLTLQLAVDNKQDNIAELSTGLFSEEFTDAHAVDINKYKQLQEVIEYAKPLQVILSQVNILSTSNAISYDLESEIKEIMRNKGYDS